MVCNRVWTCNFKVKKSASYVLKNTIVNDGLNINPIEDFRLWNKTFKKKEKKILLWINIPQEKRGYKFYAYKDESFKI